MAGAGARCPAFCEPPPVGIRHAHASCGSGGPDRRNRAVQPDRRASRRRGAAGRGPSPPAPDCDIWSVIRPAPVGRLGSTDTGTHPTAPPGRTGRVLPGDHRGWRHGPDAPVAGRRVWVGPSPASDGRLWGKAPPPSDGPTARPAGHRHRPARPPAACDARVRLSRRRRTCRGRCSRDRRPAPASSPRPAGARYTHRPHADARTPPLRRVHPDIRLSGRDRPDR